MNNKELIKPIEKELYTNCFYGFYESIFNNSDMFIDLDYEYTEEFKEQYPFILNDNDYIFVDFENFKEYEKDISAEYSEQYLNLIKELLPDKIIENKNFLLELKENYIDNPKYYNFRTDKIGLFITTNYSTLQLIKDYVLGLENIKEYIYKKNSSYNGFISFLSNDYNYWINKDIKNYEINELSFLFDALIKLNNEMDNLNFNIYYEIDAFTYAIPYISYNYKEYKLYIFEKKIKNYLKTLKAIYN